MSEQTPKDELTELQEKMAEWRKSQEKPTLYEMEIAVEKELDKLRQTLLEQLVSEAEQEDETEREICPDCQVEMMKNGRKKRRLKGKGNKTVEIEREQWRCHQCGMTVFSPR